MMERQEVVDFILSEVKRLNEEEHVLDLALNKRYKELSRVECKLSNAINIFLQINDLLLADEEIPDGGYLALAIWINTIWFADVIANEEKFAHKLAAEAGDFGKSIAWKVLDGKSVHSIEWEEFYDDSDADKYVSDEI